jgi:excisionase family DNA binding protein
MTPEQVADYLQLTKDTVYRLIRGHKLAAARIGRAYRIPREDVEAFLLAHSTRPELRTALFQRVLQVAERNAAQFPDESSDDILEELEATDKQRKAERAQAPNQ